MLFKRQMQSDIDKKLSIQQRKIEASIFNNQFKLKLSKVEYKVTKIADIVIFIKLSQSVQMDIS